MHRPWYGRRRRVITADEDWCSKCCTCGYLVVSIKCLDPYSTRFRPEKSACHFSNTLALERLASSAPRPCPCYRSGWARTRRLTDIFISIFPMGLYPSTTKSSNLNPSISPISSFPLAHFNVGNSLGSLLSCSFKGSTWSLYTCASPICKMNS